MSGGLVCFWLAKHEKKIGSSCFFLCWFCLPVTETWFAIRSNRCSNAKRTRLFFCFSPFCQLCWRWLVVRYNPSTQKCWVTLENPHKATKTREKKWTQKKTKKKVMVVCSSDSTTRVAGEMDQSDGMLVENSHVHASRE